MTVLCRSVGKRQYLSTVVCGIRAGAKAIYLGNYIKWHTKEQIEIIKKGLGISEKEFEEILLKNEELD